MTAAYAGNAGNIASTSSVLSQVVNAGAVATSTTVATSLTPSNAGASVTFTATVTGTAPTGTVNFKDGATSIAGCAAVALAGSGNARTATCATAALAAGTHSITAAYSGNAGNLASTSAALSQVVNSVGGGGLSTNVALAANGGVATASSNFVDWLRVDRCAVTMATVPVSGTAAAPEMPPRRVPDWADQLQFEDDRPCHRLLMGP
jgi:hypothetical protein